MSNSSKKDGKSNIKGEEIKDKKSGIKSEDINENAGEETGADEANTETIVEETAADEANTETIVEEAAADEEADDNGPVVSDGAAVISGETGDAAENARFRKLSFTEKCKKDPMIPVSILLAFIAGLVAALYFLLPNAKTPSMGITLNDFIHSFNNGGVATSLMDSGADIGFRTPPYVDPSANLLPHFGYYVDDAGVYRLKLRGGAVPNCAPA